MSVQEVTKADAEKRLKELRGRMRDWLAQHAEAVKAERSYRIANDFGRDFVKSKSGLGTKVLEVQDKLQAYMDRHSVWITIYKRLLRGFEDGDYLETHAGIGGICDGCNQPHLDLTKWDESYYCPGCFRLLLAGEVEPGLRCHACQHPIEGSRWTAPEGQDYCAECYALR